MANLILWNSMNIAESSSSSIRPIGPHRLAQWVRQHGYSVKVIDFCCDMSTSDLVEITSKNIEGDTIAIGVSSTFWKNQVGSSLRRHNHRKSSDFKEPQWVINAREILETRFSAAKWVLGGAHSQDYPLKFDWIRFHGHAEDNLLKFLDQESKSTLTRNSFDIKTCMNCFSNDNENFIQASEVLPIELARGCQFKCKFCNFVMIGKKKNTYLRNFDLIEREFRENYDNYGTTRYAVMDDTVNESIEKIEALADIAQRLPFKLEWIGYNRLDLIGSNKRTMSLLKDAGLKSAFFGIESFNPIASKIVGKGWNGIHGKDFLLELRQFWGNDITFHLSFIVGLPGDTVETVNESQQWCIDNDMPSWSHLPLIITRATAGVYLSEFDRTHANYGFKFPKPMDDYYWENGDWNYFSAVAKADELTEAALNHTKVTSWMMGEVAFNGLSFNELIPMYRKNIDWKTYNINVRKFIDNYVQNQLKS